MKRLLVFLILTLLATPSYAQEYDKGTAASNPGDYATTLEARSASALAPTLLRAKSSPAAVPLSWDASALERITDAVANYKSIAASHPWPMVPDGPYLNENAIDARVPLLRARLTASRDLPASEVIATSKVYDTELVGAVQRFQTRHGLVVDGIVGPETSAALNISAAERSDQLALNMERLMRLAK